MTFKVAHVFNTATGEISFLRMIPYLASFYTKILDWTIVKLSSTNKKIRLHKNDQFKTLNIIDAAPTLFFGFFVRKYTVQAILLDAGVKYNSLFTLKQTSDCLRLFVGKYCKQYWWTGTVISQKSGYLKIRDDK